MPIARRWAGGFAELATRLATPRCAADELAEARELLAYWEERAHRLPRWAVRRRREARQLAARWRVRLREAEEARYGRGVLGAASQFAVERRLPSTIAHRGQQVVRLTAYTVLTVGITLLLVLAAAVAVVGEAVLGLL
jgi:hypothetical protein